MERFRAAPATRSSYDRVCALVLKFFDAFLNDNAQAAQSLRRGADTVGQEFVVTYKAPIALTPTGKQLAVLMETKGSKPTGILLETLYASGDGNLETFAEAGRILLLDGHNKEAMELAQAYVEVPRRLRSAIGSWRRFTQQTMRTGKR